MPNVSLLPSFSLLFPPFPSFSLLFPPFPSFSLLFPPFPSFSLLLPPSLLPSFPPSLLPSFPPSLLPWKDEHLREAQPLTLQPNYPFKHALPLPQLPGNPPPKNISAEREKVPCAVRRTVKNVLFGEIVVKLHQPTALDSRICDAEAMHPKAG